MSLEFKVFNDQLVGHGVLSLMRRCPVKEAGLA